MFVIIVNIVCHDNHDKLSIYYFHHRRRKCHDDVIVAIFYPFSQFCEINISLLSLQTQPNTAPNLFQRGVEYGEYDHYHTYYV